LLLDAWRALPAVFAEHSSADPEIAARRDGMTLEEDRCHRAPKPPRRLEAGRKTMQLTPRMCAYWCVGLLMVAGAQPAARRCSEAVATWSASLLPAQTRAGLPGHS
jgi:hypothetical protein